MRGQRSRGIAFRIPGSACLCRCITACSIVAPPRSISSNQLLVEDVQARRAAAQIAWRKWPPNSSRSIIRPVDQLADVAMAETDALVWRDLLRSVKDKASPAAHGVSQHQPCLQQEHAVYGAVTWPCTATRRARSYRLLDDPNRAACWPRSTLCVSPAWLRTLRRWNDFSADEIVLRVTIGPRPGGQWLRDRHTALASGFRGCKSRNTPHSAVTALGQLREVAYIDVLVGHLDDELSVRLASVASLAQIVGRDVTLRDPSAGTGRPGHRLEKMVGRATAAQTAQSSRRAPRTALAKWSVTYFTRGLGAMATPALFLRISRIIGSMLTHRVRHSGNSSSMTPSSSNKSA